MLLHPPCKKFFLMSKLNLPSCNLLLLTAHCFIMWHSLEFDTDIFVTALQTAVGGYSITSVPRPHQCKTACIPQPSPKNMLRGLEYLGCKCRWLRAAPHCDSPWVEVGMATLIFSSNPLSTYLISCPRYPPTAMGSTA